ncbi:MAG: hypothetical protein O8C59_01765 [Candidatus Methanoperedens sp.]|nr:hypothetical protein [Candidatus Methanoperedens sp.]MCZ7397221.1 hypothetical protein [Candidatus Methanoperedens sp.]
MLKLITFLNLELISSVLFAIVALVGPMEYIRILVLFAIAIFMIMVFIYYMREKKRSSKQASKNDK